MAKKSTALRVVEENETAPTIIHAGIAQQVSLPQLRPGQEHPSGTINSRNYGRKEIAAMSASILAFGVLQPLLVVTNPENSGEYFVAAGNLRLEAMRALMEQKKITVDFVVPVIVRDDLDMQRALAASLEENVQRAPLHPVEEYECFVTLRDDRKMDVDAIAALYGLKTRDVEKRLALGRLSPMLRKAWVAEEIDANDAAAFTLTSDHKAQETLFKKFQKQGHGLHPHAIRQALIGEQRQAPGMLKAVGVDAYKAAGGTVTEDLFGDAPVVGDMVLLNKMAVAIAHEKIGELSNDGWKWVEPMTQEIGYHMHSWQRVSGGAKASKADKAISGCVVGISQYTGDLEVTYGLLKPADARKRKDASEPKGKKGEKKDAGGVISQALTQRMSEWATLAAGEALAADPKLALAAAIAGITSGGGVVQIEERGLLRKIIERGGTPTTRGAAIANANAKPVANVARTDFVKQIAALSKLSSDQLLKTLASIVGRALDMHRYTHEPKMLREKDAGALCSLIDGGDLQKALLARFDAKDYFESVAKQLSLDAITEAMGADHARQLASKPKKDVAAFAIANVPKTGWLPECLRADSYKGPSGKAAAPKKAAKKKPAKAMAARRQPTKRSKVAKRKGR